MTMTTDRPMTKTKCACGCGQKVARTFAPGHDAKLRVKLVNAALAGKPFRIYGKAVDPLEHAEQFGIAHQVQTRVFLASEAVRRTK